MARARGLSLRVRRSCLVWPLLLVALGCAKDEPRASGIPPTGGGGSSGPRPSPPSVGMGGRVGGVGGVGGAGGAAGKSGMGGMGGVGGTGPALGSDAGTGMLRLPPANASLDYQLGGAYTPPDGVQIVSRDRTESPAPGLYNICYINGFQVQQAEESFWLDEHPDLVLRDGSGDPVVDADWDEMLIDVSTPEKNVLAGARYLRLLFDRFHSADLALAAYNAGPTAVDKAGGQAPNKASVTYVGEVTTLWLSLNGCR